MPVLTQRVGHLQENYGDDRQAEELRYARDWLVEQVTAENVGIHRYSHDDDQHRADSIQRHREDTERGPRRGTPGNLPIHNDAAITFAELVAHRSSPLLDRTISFGCYGSLFLVPVPHGLDACLACFIHEDGEDLVAGQALFLHVLSPFLGDVRHHLRPFHLFLPGELIELGLETWQRLVPRVAGGLVSLVRRDAPD